MSLLLVAQSTEKLIALVVLVCFYPVSLVVVVDSSKGFLFVLSLCRSELSRNDILERN